MPWPLRIIRGLLVCFLLFGLIAAIAGLAFGRSAEQQVVDFSEGLAEIAGVVLVPMLLFGLIAVPFHRWLMKKLIGTDGPAVPDRSKNQR